MITKEDVGREFKTYRGDIYKIAYLEDFFNDGYWVMLKKTKRAIKRNKDERFFIVL